MKARITFTRIVATVACLIALVAYTAYSPVPAYACADADCCQCTKDGKSTSEGGCSGGQLCSCIHFDNGACSCSWGDGGNYCNPLLD